MKIKVIMISLLSSVIFGGALAQDIEYDDMYFNSKDRAKLTSSRADRVVLSESKKRSERLEEDESDVNPTDSYSARNVNPEYTSRAASQTAQSDDEDYFVNNYRFSTQKNFNDWNSNFNNWYNNPWYNSAYFGSARARHYSPYYSGWNNPYYGGGFYDSWGSPYYSPYNSGMYGSMSYGWGNSWNSGWGMNYGYGYGLGSNSWNNYWGPSCASYYGGGYGGYPSVIVVNERDRGVVYGKRSSRSSNLVNNDANGDRIIRGYSNNGSGSRSDNGGRISAKSTNSRQADYYDRSWRNDSRQNSNSSTGFSNSAPSRTNTWNSGTDNNNSRSTWRESNSTFSSPSPSRNSGVSSGSRSSGSSNQNSNSGSRSSSRGRGN
jgi:hypothetical protein